MTSYVDLFPEAPQGKTRRISPRDCTSEENRI
jgi:hypothetical protein